MEESEVEGNLYLMQRLKSVSPEKWWARFLWIATSYIIATDILPIFFLLVINCVGYLPYSDRPGPGWQPAHWPAHEEWSFFLGFSFYLGSSASLYAAGQSVLALAYWASSLPRWLVRILGGISGFLGSGLLMAGAGWMIAIAPIGIYLAAGAGLLWGVFVLPLLVGRREPSIGLPWRMALSGVLWCAAIFYLARPLLPHKQIPPVAFLLKRLMPGPMPVDWPKSQYFREETWSDLNELHLRGELHSGVQVSMSGDGQEIEVALITLQPIDREYRLTIPASGHVVYVLENGNLEPHPAFTKKDKRTIVLKPGADTKWDGGEINTGGEFSSFTWYPTIPR